MGDMKDHLPCIFKWSFAKIEVKLNLLLKTVDMNVCFACNLANGPVVSSALVALVVVGGGI